MKLQKVIISFLITLKEIMEFSFVFWDLNKRLFCKRAKEKNQKQKTYAVMLP